MVVGGNTFTSSALEFAAGVVIDQRAMVGFRLEDGHYLLTVALFDESNEPIVQIKDNWLAYSVEPWDIEFVGSKLTIRSGYRKIFIEILFEVPDKITLIRGRLLLNGVELYIRPTFIYVINSRQLIDHYSSDNVTVGLNLGEPLNVNVGVHLGNLPRYNIDREAAIRALRGKLEKMKGL
jgi:trigger factor